ncbi:MAG TPA: hypothetical protein VKE41_04000 [Roseiflexaceae bacterium]|nr:hypothetical protein [Roseiflexaceae bacterium]
MDTFIESLRGIFTLLLIAMGVSVVLASIGLVLLARSIRRLHIPPDVDFFTTMRYIPLPLVIVLDLLDFGLDIFSAPILWVALDRMGLYNLRNKATIEALIPFTNVIPTFTVSWFVARLLNLGVQPWQYEEDYWADQPSRLSRRRPSVIDLDDRRYYKANRNDRG